MRGGVVFVSLKTFLIIMLTMAITTSAAPIQPQVIHDLGMPEEITELSEEYENSSIFDNSTQELNTSFTLKSDTGKLFKEIWLNRLDEIPENDNMSDNFNLDCNEALNHPEDYFKGENTDFQYSESGASESIPTEEIAGKAIETQHDLNQSVLSDVVEFQNAEIRLTPEEYEELAWDFIGGLWMLAVAFINIYATHYSKLAMTHVQENASWAGFYL